MNWKETRTLRREPTKIQNTIMDIMSDCGLALAYIATISPLVTIVIVFIQFVK